MRLSTRNQLSGMVTAINPGSVMSTVKQKDPLLPNPRKLGSGPEREPIAVGDPIVVLVKSTEVMLGVPD